MTERANYIRHIKRLQQQNRVLRSVVVEERLARQAAYGWYVRRLRSRWLWVMDFMVFGVRGLL